VSLGYPGVIIAEWRGGFA